MKDRYVQGIWDGHDAGAALIAGEEIVFAANEERFTRRKLEVGFPRLSIKAGLKSAGLAITDIRTIAASTTDPAKTLTRLFPSLPSRRSITSSAAERWHRVAPIPIRKPSSTASRNSRLNHSRGC